jgi:hypothetical protein
LTFGRGRIKHLAAGVASATRWSGAAALLLSPGAAERPFVGTKRVRKGKRFWEQLAAAVRSQAETEVKMAKRKVLLRICAAYERLATTAARIENGQAKVRRNRTTKLDAHRAQGDED